MRLLRRFAPLLFVVGLPSCDRGGLQGSSSGDDTFGGGTTGDAHSGGSSGGATDAADPRAAFAGNWTGTGTYRNVCTGACSAPGVPCNSSLPCSQMQSCVNGQCQGPRDTGVIAGSVDLTFDLTSTGLVWVEPAHQTGCNLAFNVVGSTATIQPNARCNMSPCSNNTPSYLEWTNTTLTLTGTGTATWHASQHQVECGGGASGGNDIVITFDDTLTLQP